MLIGYDSNNALSLSVFLPLSLTSHATSMLVPLLVIVTQPFFSVRAARRNRNHCRDAVRAAFRFATREWILSVTTRTWHRHLITNNNNESNENNDDKAHRSYEGYTQTTMTMMKSVPAFFALLFTTTISSVAGFAVLPTAIPRGVGRTTTTSCDAFSTRAPSASRSSIRSPPPAPRWTGSAIAWSQRAWSTASPTPTAR